MAETTAVPVAAFMHSESTAPATTGIPSRKENSAESSRESPQSTPAAKVVPAARKAGDDCHRLGGSYCESCFRIQRAQETSPLYFVRCRKQQQRGREECSPKPFSSEKHDVNRIP